MPEHEFMVWAPIPERGAARRRGASAPDDARRRRLVAGRPWTPPTTPATGSCSTTIRRCCPIRARPGSRTGCTSARSCGDARPGRWTDRLAGRSIERRVIYELHVGTFTPEGTFDAAIEKLDHLVDLGVDSSS